MTSLAVITIGMDPTIELGPITLAWHGITIAIGAGAVSCERRQSRVWPARSAYRLESTSGSCQPYG